MGLRVGVTALLAVSLSSAACAGARPPAPAPATRAVGAGNPEPGAVDERFASSVRPVLARSCKPCHEPGGRMYDRLPFDDPGVVADHRDGVLRRLKGEDRTALEGWLAGRAP